MKLTIAQYKQLQQDMRVTFAYFKMTPEAQKVARDSASQRTVSAYRCYRAIVRSL